MRMVLAARDAGHYLCQSRKHNRVGLRGMVRPGLNGMLATIFTVPARAEPAPGLPVLGASVGPFLMAPRSLDGLVRVLLHTAMVG